MGDRGWTGPSHFDGNPASYGDGLELPLGARALREAIQRMRERVSPSSVSALEELLGALSRLSALEKEIKAQRALLIAELLARGGTWQKAAEACGCKKQTLHKAHHAMVDALSGICNGSSGEKALRVMQLLHPQAVDSLIIKGHVEPQLVPVNGRLRLVLRRNPAAIASDAEFPQRRRPRSVVQSEGLQLRAVPLSRRGKT